MSFLSSPIRSSAIFHGLLFCILISLLLLQNTMYRVFTGDHLQSTRRNLILAALRDPVSTGNSLELRQRISDLEKSLSISCIEVMSGSDNIHSCVANPESNLKVEEIIISSPYGTVNNNDFVIRAHFSDSPYEKRFKNIFYGSLLLSISALICNWLITLRLARNVNTKGAYNTELKRLYRLFHDIKSPLSSLGISIDHQKTLDEERTNLVRRSHAAIKILIDLGLKAKSKENDSNLSIEKTKTTEIRNIVDESIELLLPQAVASENRILFRCVGSTDQQRHLLLSPETVLRVVTNLLKNSLEAGKNMEISLTLGLGTDSIFFSISDSGVGFEPKFLEAAGDLEFTTKATGNGIGLSFIKEAIENGLGNLKIFSADKGGTLVHIELPHFPSKFTGQSDQSGHSR